MRFASFLAVPLLIVLVGCGSVSSSKTVITPMTTAPKSATTATTAADNGMSGKDPQAILDATLAAAKAATSVHVAGTITDSGAQITLNLRLVSGQGGQGTIAQNGTTFGVITIGDAVYLKGSTAFYESLGGAAAAKLLQGKWLKVSATGKGYESFAILTDMQKFFDKVLTPSTTASLSKSTETFAGQPAVALSEGAGKGSLVVAATGTPYPLALRGPSSGKSTGQLVFDQWDKPVTLTAPADAIDVAQLQALAKG